MVTDPTTLAMYGALAEIVMGSVKGSGMRYCVVGLAGVMLAAWLANPAFIFPAASIM